MPIGSLAGRWQYLLVIAMDRPRRVLPSIERPGHEHVVVVAQAQAQA